MTMFPFFPATVSFPFPFDADPEDHAANRSVLYTTLSPCAMCSGAILLYGIPKIVVGENQTFKGDEYLLRSRGAQVHVLQDATCVELMRSFIASKPELWSEDIGV
jgi:cytosine deaminase